MLNQFSRKPNCSLATTPWRSSPGCRVAVFGIGGVGGYTVEALARSGVGALDLIDDDRVCLTNINRQLLALRTTVGQYKVDVAAERVRAINPNCTVNNPRAPRPAGNEGSVRLHAVRLRRRRDRHRLRQARPRRAGEGRRNACRLRHGRRAIRSTPRPSAWPTSVETSRLPAGARDARPMPEARHQKAQGRLLAGKAAPPCGGRGHRAAGTIASARPARPANVPTAATFRARPPSSLLWWDWSSQARS